MVWVYLFGYLIFSCRYRLSRSTNTIAWIMATASSKIVRRNSTTMVDMDRMGMVGNRVNTAVEVS